MTQNESIPDRPLCSRLVCVIPDVVGMENDVGTQEVTQQF